MNEVASSLAKQTVQGDALVAVTDPERWAAWTAEGGRGSLSRRKLARAWRSAQPCPNASSKGALGRGAPEVSPAPISGADSRRCGGAVKPSGLNVAAGDIIASADGRRSSEVTPTSAPRWDLLPADVLAAVFCTINCADAVAATGVCRLWRQAAVQVRDARRQPELIPPSFLCNTSPFVPGHCIPRFAAQHSRSHSADSHSRRIWSS